MADNNNFEKKEIQSDDPIIQKCLDIVRNKKVTVKDLSDLGYYDVYLGNKKCFMIHKDFLIGVGTVYQMDVNNQNYRFFCGQRPDLDELHRLCVAKYNEQSPERKKVALNFLNDVDKIDETGKPGKQKLTTLASDVLISLGVVGIICVSGFLGYTVKEKKVQRVDKKVEAYEKTLPAEYLEYKHAVEHYRDSLMHAKRR